MRLNFMFPIIDSAGTRGEARRWVKSTGIPPPKQTHPLFWSLLFSILNPTNLYASNHGEI